MAAIDPGLGGVVIAGGRGTGKSVLARGLHALLPAIEEVEGSWNEEPDGVSPSKVIPAPFVQIPRRHRRQAGGLSRCRRSLSEGRNVFQPGFSQKLTGVLTSMSSTCSMPMS